MAHSGFAAKIDPAVPVADGAPVDAPGRDAAVADYAARLDACVAAISRIDQEIRVGPDAQFARSLLDFNERLTRIEKQIAFMSSAQALQEKQMDLNKRATALDLAIKARGPDDSGGDTTATAEAFLVWLNGGAAG